jgi:hypothetical protein
MNFTGGSKSVSFHSLPWLEHFDELNQRDKTAAGNNTRDRVSLPGIITDEDVFGTHHKVPDA